MSEELTKCEATGTATAVTARPAYRTRETENGISLDVGLPGVRKEDLKVTFHEGVLTLRAERARAIPGDWKVLRDQGHPDRYELRVRLHSSLDPQRTTAELADGLLRLAIAKREEALPRRIEIN